VPDTILFGTKGPMKNPMAMQYWKGDGVWLGRLVEYPHVTAQGRTLKELEENIADAYRQMAAGEAPAGPARTSTGPATPYRRGTGSVPLFPAIRCASRTTRRHGFLAKIRAAIRRLV
jgi:predicted RNase H-like HicB family nuclease